MSSPTLNSTSPASLPANQFAIGGACKKINDVLALALVVLNCIVIHNAPNCSPNIIWSIIGVQGASGLWSIIEGIKYAARGQCSRNKALTVIINVCINVCLIALPVLTLQGFIAQKTLGWIYVWTFTAALGLTCCCFCCTCCYLGAKGAM